MSERNLQLRVLFAAADKFTAPVKKMMGGSQSARTEVKRLHEQIKKLSDQSAKIDGFKKLSAQTAVTSNLFKAAQERAKALENALLSTKQPSAALVRGFENAHKEADKLKTKLGEMQKRLDSSGDALKAAGVDTKGLSTHQNQLADQVQEANKQLDEQKAKLEKVGQASRAMRAARADYDRGIAMRDKVAGAGVSAGIAGAAIGAPVLAAVKSYSELEDAMLGVAKQVEGARDSSGQLTSTYYEMRGEIQDMARTLPVATTDLARLMEGAAKMGIKGKQELSSFTKDTAITAIAFDLPADQVAEDMAKIANMYKIPIPAIRSFGDALNWLDDNALASGGDIMTFMKNVGGTASMVKISARETAALGSTLLSAGEKAETASTAINAVFSKLGAANTQVKPFRAMVDDLGLSTAELERMMQTDAVAGINTVMDAIQKLPVIAKQGEISQIDAVATLFGAEHWDTFSKLIQNRGEMTRQLGLANSAESSGSMAREAAARTDTLSGQKQIAANRFSELTSTLGETLVPVLKEANAVFGPLMDRINAWVKANPELAGGIMKATAAFSALLLTFATATAALAAFLGPFFMLRLGMATLGIRAGSTAPSLLKVSGEQTRLGAATHIAQKAVAGLSGRMSTLWQAAKGMTWSKLGSGVSAYASQTWAATRASAALAKANALAMGSSALQQVKMLGSSIAGIPAKISSAGGLGSIFKASATQVFAQSLRGVLTLLRTIGSVFLMNPIGLALAALTVGAVLVMKYWQPIKAFFSGFVDGFIAGLAPVMPAIESMMSTLGTMLAPLRPVWDWFLGALQGVWQWITNLLAPFQATQQEIGKATEAGRGFGQFFGSLASMILTFVPNMISAGAQLISGVITGIKNMLGALKDTVAGAAGSAAEWFRRKLDIHSPSRVFATLGMQTIQGFLVGVNKQDGNTRNVMGSVVDRITSAFPIVDRLRQSVPRLLAGLGLTAALPALASAMPQLDTRPPLMASAPAMAAQMAGAAAGGGYAAAAAPITINIYGAPGQSEQQLAKLVAREFEKLQRQQAARARGRMADRD